jgi:hypothetical protein
MCRGCLKYSYVQGMNLLRGKTMECVGLICGCLPPELSVLHAEPIVVHMIRIQVRPCRAVLHRHGHLLCVSRVAVRVVQAAGFDEDDEDSYRYMTLAFSRLAESMGEAFAPYMPAVLPPIIAQATAIVRARMHAVLRCSVSRCAVYCCSVSDVLCVTPASFFIALHMKQSPF